MKKAGKVLVRVLLFIVFVVGILLIFNEPIKNWLVSTMSERQMNVSRQQIQENELHKGQFDFAKVKSIDTTQVVQAAVNSDVSVIGKLAIPAVGMRLPIVKGLSDAALSTGGGTMKPDQVMGEGNYALAGHYMTNKGILFSPLEDTQLGQQVYLTDLEHVYIYKITWKKIVDPTAVYLINDVSGDTMVTLITCADGGVNRWAIRGHLVSREPANKQTLAVFSAQ
ncbi:MAG: class A sortase [Schleiferilactobacillus perolens]|nr:class A sortase [Schleiferilactobacillus perolens]MCI1891692.1 class A sortase [Schleiferilactobacillus harbinensis]MCI1912038.1 class A sortase [Schleiferilactobacillus harbinensis]MCI2171758.1 class A sortase [Schleiferilactobacillus perolens]